MSETRRRRKTITFIGELSPALLPWRPGDTYCLCMSDGCGWLCVRSHVLELNQVLFDIGRIGLEKYICVCVCVFESECVSVKCGLALQSVRL